MTFSDLKPGRKSLVGLFRALQFGTSWRCASQKPTKIWISHFRDDLGYATLTGQRPQCFQLWRGKGPSVSNPPQIFLAKAAPWKCLVFHIGGPENFKFQKKQLPQQRANLTTSPHFFEGSENNLTWTCTSKNQQEIKSWMGQRWESPKYEWQFSRRRVTIQIADVLIDLDRQFLYLDPISQSRFGKKKAIHWTWWCFVKGEGQIGGFDHIP